MSEDWQFEGFSDPAYTQTPDAVFDFLMPRLSESELKVLLYVIRRTFGFKKQSDDISLRQMVEGIRTKDGRQLDNGTGLSRPSVTKGVRGLVAHGVLTAVRNSSQERGDEPTSYRLRFRGDPVETSLPRGSQESFEGGGNDLPRDRRKPVTPQETVIQKTERQVPSNYSSDLETISYVISDIAQEFNDQAPLKSSTSRAANLYRESGLELDAFLDLLQTARLRTKRYTSNITEIDKTGRKKKMSYWFSVLEDLLVS